MANVSSRKAGAVGAPVRIQNVAVETDVLAEPGVLHRVILANSGAAATLTIKDGATTLVVLNVPANTAPPVSLEIGIPFADLTATPSHASVDALFIIN